MLSKNLLYWSSKKCSLNKFLTGLKKNKDEYWLFLAEEINGKGKHIPGSMQLRKIVKEAM